MSMRKSRSEAEDGHEWRRGAQAESVQVEGAGRGGDTQKEGGGGRPTEEVAQGRAGKNPREFGRWKSHGACVATCISYMDVNVYMDTVSAVLAWYLQVRATYIMYAVYKCVMYVYIKCQ